MWDVIVWDNAIDFVPSSWANDDNTQYKYPTNLSEPKVREKIYECQDLERNFLWCKAELKKQHIKSLQRAKDLCEQGQYTSNIETSDDENVIIRKRPRRLIEECGEVNRKQLSRLSEGEDNIDEIEEVSVHKSKKTFSFPKNKKLFISAKDSPVSNCSSSPTSFLLQYQDAGDVPISSLSNNDTPTQLTNSSPKINNLLKAILKNQADIKYELKEIKKNLNDIENRQLTRNIPNITESVFATKLPLTTVEAVTAVEDLIQDQKLFKEFVQLLYLVGGDTLVKVISGILKKLLHPEVAVLYSGVGKKHKLPFCTLKIYKAVQAAVRKRIVSASESEIQKTVSQYLAQSKARLKIKEREPQDMEERNVN